MRNLISVFLHLPRFYKRLISVFADVFILLFSVCLALTLRFGEMSWVLGDYFWVVILLPAVAIPIFISQGMYRAVVRYIGSKFVFTVVRAILIVFIVWAALIFMLDLSFPRTAIVITGLVALSLIFLSRYLARRILFLRTGSRAEKPSQRKVVIFGAGSAGRQLFNAILKIPHIYVVGFIDDDKNLQNHEVSGVPVYRREDMPKLISKHDVSEAYLAIPSLGLTEKRNLLNFLEPFPVKILTIPGVDEMVSGRISFSELREVDIADLLGRDEVCANKDLLDRCIRDQVVLITGAGGSIGSELCRQVARLAPRQIILFELSEFALYSIDRELREWPSLVDTPIISILGSVLDEQKLRRLYTQYAVNTVYHAAAYKHVPIVEHNIQEGIFNNSFGTHMAAKVAAECGVQNFVLVSTDKAVRPTNFMGASKRLAEMSLQALQLVFPNTRFVMVRFGNVLGSSGSVIPLFRKQIANGGPVTVTHKDITRFFMTIPEAASLVIQAGSMGIGGDVFVLDMGEPVKIDDLARRVIHLSGLKLKDESREGDIEIVYSGLRPGEKLYEELLIGDNVAQTEHPRIMKAHEEFLDYDRLQTELIELENALVTFDYERVERQFLSIINGFNHPSGLVDYLYQANESPAI